MAGDCFVLTFASTHQAIAMEKQLQQQFAPVLMPTPRQIASGCGFALKICGVDRAALQEAIQDCGGQCNLYLLQGGAYLPCF